MYSNVVQCSSMTVVVQHLCAHRGRTRDRGTKTLKNIAKEQDMIRSPKKFLFVPKKS